MIVLKILLIILGILLGILLFLVLAVLFCPFRYKISGESLEDISVNAKVTWFLSIAGFYFLYGPEGKMQMWLRILFWKKMLMEEDSDSEETKIEEDDSDFKDIKEQGEAAISTPAELERSIEPENPAESVSSMESSDLSEVEKREADSQNDAVSEKVEENIEEPTSKKNRKGNLGKNIKDIIERIKAFDYDDRDKAALSHLKEELVKFLKHICPKKARLNLTYSTGSPDTTGISLGVIAMFPIAYKNRFNIVPDFQSEEAYAKGDGWMKGRIYIYFLLGIVIRVLRDKNCTRLYHKIKNF